MSLLLLRRARAVQRTLGPPPSPGEVIVPAVFRSWRTPVDAEARGTLPLPPNHGYTLDEVVLWRNGAEVPLHREWLRGAHNDGAGGNGGPLAMYYQCDTTGWSPSDVLEWRLGTPRTAPPASATGRGAQTVTQSVVQNPRVILPTAPAYLCSTRVTGLPLVPASEQTPAETAFFDTLHDESVETWVDLRWSQYNPIDGTITPQWNLDQAAGYQVPRGYWAKWCRTGDPEYWWRATRHLEAWFSGYGTTVIPAEAWSMIYFDLSIGYLLSGRAEYWALPAATAVAPISEGAALSSGVEVTAKAAHLSNEYGIRFNLRQKWAAVVAAHIDAKRVSALRQPTFAVEMPWLIDSFAASAYTRSDLACLAGLTGMRDTVTGEDPAASPLFWIAIVNAWYMDYYHLVHADARIPSLVKANLDVLLGQLHDLGGGRRGMAYLWGCPKAALGVDSPTVLLPMFAAAAAWISALYDSGGSTTYADLYADCIDANNVSVAGDIQYNATKLYGELWGWTQSAPFFRALGAPGGPTVIREPETYA